MAISNKVKKLVALALQDRIITHKERQVIVETAMQEGATFQEIDRYISDAVSERLKSYQKEQLTNCPKCGAPVPLIADECPHCGQSLYHEETKSVKTVNISGDAAEIIRAENRQTADERQYRTRCECGAPMPLISNVCSYCGRVFHKDQESSQNIKNLIDNINENINKLKGTLRPSFWMVLKHRLNLIFFYFASVFFVLCLLSNNGEYLCMSVSMLPIAVLTLAVVYHDKNQSRPKADFDGMDVFTFNVQPIFEYLVKITYFYMFDVQDAESPVHAADKVYFDAMHAYERYQRQVSTIYGAHPEAKKLLEDYAAEIDDFKKVRNRNRALLAALMVAIMILPFLRLI
ncbi:MAG: zinc ribbon domain-containing protein [Bacteroidales bacterium]|nr:zinc ribbon domain-containing protein [Bacteroidales bacterium]